MSNENLKVTIDKRDLFNMKTVTYVNSKGEKVSFETNAGIGAMFKVIQDELKDKGSFNISNLPKVFQRIEITFPLIEYDDFFQRQQITLCVVQ